MDDVTVWILHPEAGPAAGELERWVAAERARNAARQRTKFLAAGATDVTIVSGPPDDTPFGARFRALLDGRRRRAGGIVVLGSGAAPLASARDLRPFVEVAGGSVRSALANNRFSADVVAIGCVEQLPPPPDLPADNALPRWLAEVAGYHVDDRRANGRLALDLDGPIELLLVGSTPPIDVSAVRSQFASIAAIAADRRAELLVAGRVSSSTLSWLERGTAARIRALVEERGMRAASQLALPGQPPPQRAPASVLGLLLDRDGPAALAEHLERLADAAVIDSRVLVAHRFGADEAHWPPPEDRFASDVLLPERISDPWLRELTASAIAARVPVVLGGHTLVGPGLRRLLSVRRWT